MSKRALLMACVLAIVLAAIPVARADVLYAFTATHPAAEGMFFTYRSPSLITGDVSVPAADLESCGFGAGVVDHACLSIDFLQATPGTLDDIVGVHFTYPVPGDWITVIMGHRFAAGSISALGEYDGITSYTAHLSVTEVPSIAPVPEPLGVALLGTVLGAVSFGVWRRKRAV
ncbi:MAG: PEP-CTERM sorting domain-containing protein [Candidatus Solibacter sp.]|nr:PEP-CTERM sorting domain-containing protein [Candidatus Solibacter sp.]